MRSAAIRRSSRHTSAPAATRRRPPALDTLTIGVSLGCVYALVALGFSLVYRTTGVLSFAQGAFVMVGGMSGAGLVDEVGLPTGLAIVGGSLIGGLAGLVLVTCVVSPLWRRGATAFIVILGTLVFLVVCENVVLN